MKGTPSPSTPPLRLFEALAAAVRDREPVALCTVVATRGSPPQTVGARMVVRPTGEPIGTVGGGRFELTVMEEARARLSDGRPPVLLEIDLGDLGMACGGHMTVFVDVMQPRERLLVFGAGHVGRTVAAAAARVGFHVTVIDDRAEWADPAHLPSGAEIAVTPFLAFLDTYTPQGDDYAVIVTRGHEHDEAVLRRLVDAPIRYLGMMGSQRKVREMKARLAAEGTAPEHLDRLDAPVGLPIGAVTPEELALSIVGRLVATRRGAALGGLGRGKA